MTFFRLTTDHHRTDAALDDSFAGPIPSACWLIGGGASLAASPLESVKDLPIPRMSVNLAGTGLIRPHMWTSYDPTARFHRSTYLDPGIMKFVHRRRAMDLVPDTTFKVCECPNLYFFDRLTDGGFRDPLQPDGTGILDWADSMAQAIAILYRLGFRTIYCLGCELRIAPPDAWKLMAAARGVTGHEDALGEYLKRCEQAGLSRDELQKAAPLAQYHFDEAKPLDAAISTDFHYFRIVQYLRLCRVAFAKAGLNLISATANSRLNDFFPYRSIEDIARDVRESVGDAGREPTRGKYTGTPTSSPTPSPAMRDFRPPHAVPPPCPPALPEAKPATKPHRAAEQINGEILIETEGPAVRREPHRRFADYYERPDECPVVP